MKKFNLDAYSPLHKTGHTSKGDQRKWRIDDFWYKADYMGYEGLSEALISRLLKRSKVSWGFVNYDSIIIEYHGEKIHGCVSENFLKEHELLLPVEKLYRRYTGESLAVKLSEFTEVSEKIQYMVTTIEEITQISGFGQYITAMLEIDAIFLNEDRHTNNIAVIYNEKTQQYAVSPFFDQGLCLFSDITQDYPLGCSIEACMERIEAKPFCSEFDIQLDAAEELYGVQVQFGFSYADVETEMKEISEQYPKEVCQRVLELLRIQMRKYAYLFRKN